MHRLLSSSSAASALMGMTDPAAMQGLTASLPGDGAATAPLPTSDTFSALLTSLTEASSTPVTGLPLASGAASDAPP